MPTITLNDEDIKKAINYLTDDRYNVNTIVKKKINEEGELEIVWSYKII
jgi:hypothetical protein